MTVTAQAFDPHDTVDPGVGTSGTSTDPSGSGTGSGVKPERHRKGRDRASVEWVKVELMRVAYATRGGFLARRDPRAVLGWYVILAVAPWLTYSKPTLMILAGLALASALAARIGPLLLGLFLFGLLGQILYLGVMIVVFGGNTAAIEGLVEVSLKLGIISLASMAAFVSLDPEKLSDGLAALRAPAVIGFGVSYAYRMIPLLIDEFQTIIDGHRLRGAPPAGHGFLGWRTARRIGIVAVQSFYPLFLNTAKRTRTTVEALETRGFTLTGGANPAGRALRLSALRFTHADALLLVATMGLVVGAFWAGGVLETGGQPPGS
ncbi:energy-coupling factor transporter transmembrane protein EcfT [Nocardioides sp. Y6]|uniref:Energy-coupling factor transporter transmembrane protein EcfT n=1 Tax=Nocardioides malaquae TaxID=2773426 RepID=A0ABR9RQF4_9ACTN|nr:energy-coupling factor transporter transmembrane component T [Nocardioides malaquae]MBE7323432.1 energy-coupling factor transporter transmembrane protein EcfT [Nocardioides malaquae]